MVLVALLSGPLLLGFLLLLDYYEEHMLGEAQPRQSSRGHLRSLPAPSAEQAAPDPQDVKKRAA